MWRTWRSTGPGCRSIRRRSFRTPTRGREGRAGFTNHRREVAPVHTLGQDVVPLYLAAAFLGMFATVLGVIDGFPRGVSRALQAVGHDPAQTEGGREVRYWWLLYATVAVGVVVAVFLPEPAVLVSLAATATVLLAPLWYLMILLCVHRLPEEDRPPRGLRVWAWVGVVGMVGIALAVGWLSVG